ncbi:MAG TPA: pyridoxal phosphate-dependent aminotransferase family protein [Anaerolineaceae bacterium]
MSVPPSHPLEGWERLRMESPPGARTVFNGREYDYFAGTGYLGLQAHPEVMQAAVAAIQRYGISTATSRGGYGEHPVYDSLRQSACDFFAAEEMITFPSGYMGMTVLTQATGLLYDHIFIDSWAHYSLWDAAQATNKPITPFHHRNPQHLADLLRHELHPGERPLVVSDGVFPISGEIAPLPAYLEAITPYGGQVYLDDAHAVGVLGIHGRGTPDFYGIQDSRCRTSGTLAKALGGYGGIIWGEKAWVNEVERNSRVCAGSSPPPLPIAAASASALTLARNPALREQLWKNVAQARQGCRDLGWAIEDTPVPILCLSGRPEIDLGTVKANLFEQGIAVAHVRSYTSTPPGGALRVAIFATHTSEQIDHLLQALDRWCIL